MSDAVFDMLSTVLPDLEATGEEVEAAELAIAPEPEPEAPEEEEETPDTEPDPSAKPPAPPKPEDPKGKAFLNDELFTDEALATPEGIAAARAAVQAREAHTHRVYLKTFRREQETEQRVQTAKAYEQRALDVHRLVDANVGKLTSGDPNQALEALGVLMRMDGVAAYEQLTGVILGRGKAQKEDPNAPIRQELSAIKQELQRRDAAAAQEREQQAMLRTHSTWAVMAQDPAQFPALAHVISTRQAQSPELGRQAVNEIVRQAAEEYENHVLAQRARGIPNPQFLDWGTLLGRIEAAMLPHVRDALGQTGSPEAGRATSGNPKPGTQARLPGRTASPTRASAAVSRKSRDELTEEERFDDLLRDTDGLNQLLGTSFQ